MSIRPVVLNGMIQRTQDVGNEYEGESGRHKKRREEEPENEGKVILKGQGSHFDIKI